MKKHNFSAGPCILPQEVFKQASEAVLNFNNLDLSILEISHRSKDFVDVMEEARELVLELMGLEGKGYKALTMADHNRMSKKGYTHTKPKKKKAMGGQVQGCGCPYGMQMGPNSLL